MLGRRKSLRMSGNILNNLEKLSDIFWQEGKIRKKKKKRRLSCFVPHHMILTEQLVRSSRT